MNKRGILLTLGIFFILMVLLSSSMIIYRSSLTSSQRAGSVEKMDRLNDVYKSTELGIREIFLQNSGIDINFTAYDMGVAITEDIPNNRSYDFNLTLLDFKAFVEQNFPEVYIDPLQLLNLPLIIRPENITYTHTDGYGFQRVQVIPKELNFNSYEIEIYNPADNVTGIQWGSQAGGDFNLKIVANDAFGNYFEEERGIDPDKAYVIDIKFEHDNDVKIKILPNANGMLEVENKAEQVVTSKISIGFNYTRDNSEMSLSDKLINVTYPKLKNSKVGTVRIR